LHAKIFPASILVLNESCIGAHELIEIFSPLAIQLPETATATAQQCNTPTVNSDRKLQNRQLSS
jgi:hypothetical protein